MNCTNHPETAAIAVCSECGRALCDSCALRLDNAIVCKACLEGDRVGKKKSKAKSPKTFRKSPWLAAILSLFPGIGQVYVGYYAVGFIYALVMIGCIMILSSSEADSTGPMVGTFLAFFWIFNMFDAARRASMYNRGLAGEDAPKMPTDSPLIGGILLAILGIVMTLQITLGVDMDFITKVWPLAILVMGIYFIWKYLRMRRELGGSETPQVDQQSGFSPSPPSSDTDDTNTGVSG
jgi:hypothetical protein